MGDILKPDFPNPRLSTVTGEVPSVPVDLVEGEANFVPVPVEELQAMRIMAVRLIHFIDCRLTHHYGDDDGGAA